jgi:antitoxin component YwqK of YwqJK toxin-antitoxin module
MTRVNTDVIEFTDDYVYLLNGQPFTGIGFETNDNGVVISEMEFQNGMKHGTTRGFYPTGRVKREVHYQHNTLDGFVRDWSEDGLMEREEEYEKGICVRRKALDSSGQVALSYELSESDPQHMTLQLLRNAKFNQTRG